MEYSKRFLIRLNLISWEIICKMLSLVPKHEEETEKDFWAQPLATLGKVDWKHTDCIDFLLDLSNFFRSDPKTTELKGNQNSWCYYVKIKCVISAFESILEGEREQSFFQQQIYVWSIQESKRWGSALLPNWWTWSVYMN